MLVYSCYVWALIWFEFGRDTGKNPGVISCVAVGLFAARGHRFHRCEALGEKVLVLLIYLLSIAPIADLLIYLSLWAKRNALRVVKVSDFGVS